MQKEKLADALTTVNVRFKMIKLAYWTNVLSKFDMVLYQLIQNISPVNPDPNKYIVHHCILAISARSSNLLRV